MEFASAKFGSWMIVSRKRRFEGNKERESSKASSRNISGKWDEDNARQTTSIEATNGDETASTTEMEFASAKFGSWMIVSRKRRFEGNKERESSKASSRNISGKWDEGPRFLPMIL
ncbi:hypothetical protein WN944_022517 [Citrus x changshan-huyou]|uniref:Uncharacterized protein n=1 Tax=Citrus x changshan-huyou TaxID=2935761 RepID=A0AAP0N4F7_9ROSI